MDPDAFVEIVRAKPALHRFPASMGGRIQDMCRHLVEHYDGDAAARSVEEHLLVELESPRKSATALEIEGHYFVVDDLDRDGVLEHEALGFGSALGLGDVRRGDHQASDQGSGEDAPGIHDYSRTGSSM